ncbi:F0F1 ATP synthase subunit epsilon [Sulfurimonas sp. MAG313]|nr:ATP synthase F1 subunit epsilon [Sulfurimonas sp. MAG313]MDF1881932.1 F0F1 ATP synthase subunit epsilon [Sulfurimonas sp. MAG313]
MNTLNLEIVTPSGVIFAGPVTEVTLPGEEGEFGVLPEHSSLTTLLEAGVVDFVKEDKTKESVVINWGHVQVDESKVIVLADGAVALRGDNESDIATALADAKALVEAASNNAITIAAVSAKLETAAQNLI